MINDVWHLLLFWFFFSLSSILNLPRNSNNCKSRWNNLIIVHLWEELMLFDYRLQMTNFIRTTKKSFSSFPFSIFFSHFIFPARRYILSQLSFCVKWSKQYTYNNNICELGQRWCGKASNGLFPMWKDAIENVFPQTQHYRLSELEYKNVKKLS